MGQGSQIVLCEKLPNVELWNSKAVTQAKGYVDGALFDIPDFGMIQVITPLIEIQRLDAVFEIGIDGLNAGDEIRHRGTIQVVVCLGDDQGLVFDLIADGRGKA